VQDGVELEKIKEQINLQQPELLQASKKQDSFD
jgi:hypothetical protein